MSKISKCQGFSLRLWFLPSVSGDRFKRGAVRDCGFPPAERAADSAARLCPCADTGPRSCYHLETAAEHHESCFHGKLARVVVMVVGSRLKTQDFMHFRHLRLRSSNRDILFGGAVPRGCCREQLDRAEVMLLYCLYLLN